ncbi:MAG: glycosyltransferase [Erysipelotrichaceae bacterium]|nr:glycosyltransferase [Erysipelotrichaceae bacterium]MDD3924687.1 glycosyltransferase [Erysipelotrichaceae bacterium]MDD4643228.1 glycosyltransferase [Erysipelotrichaceae bacterium]
MEKVSIIVPVYNVESYLDECLTSLVNQSLNDIKIIIVNDGSTDSSQKIIDRYALRYPEKILALNKENGGLASARNFGLQYAQGEYVGFVDSDDYVDVNMYNEMYNLAIKNNADLVVCDLEYFFEYSNKEPFVSKGLNLSWNSDYHKAAILSPMFAWNKLYKKELFINNGIEYPVGLWYEDIPVTISFILLANKIVALDMVGVYYRQRENSIMKSKYNPKMHDIFKILKIALEKVKEAGLYELYHDELEYFFIEHLLFYGAFRFLRSDGYNRLIPEAINVIKDKFPNWRRNQYLKKLSFKNRFFINTISPITAYLYKIYLEKHNG